MRFFKNSYATLVEIGDAIQPWLLLALRLFWGVQFYLAGWGKLHTFKEVTRYFVDLGIPFPEINAHIITWVEICGGIALALGIASRLMVIPLIIAMLVAYATAHYSVLQHLLTAPNEFVTAPPFLFLLTCLIVFAFGPGRWSVDGIFGKEGNY